MMGTLRRLLLVTACCSAGLRWCLWVFTPLPSEEPEVSLGLRAFTMFAGPLPECQPLPEPRGL